MKQITLRAPTGHTFILRENGHFEVQPKRMAWPWLAYEPLKAEVVAKIADWIRYEGWLRVFESAYYPLRVEDITLLGESHK